MLKLLKKEVKLAASPLSFIFISASLLAFVPGYPILLGAFFTCLGLFYSFQSGRENNDVGYSLLLPVGKAAIVKGRFLFVLLVEGCSFAVMAAVTLVRMALLSSTPVYTSNALMCANFTFLGGVLLVFGLFNSLFVAGFFKTAYYFGKPFILFCAVSLVVIIAAEALHYVPGFSELNSFGFEPFAPQASALLLGAAAFALLTALGFRLSVKRFEKTDL